LLQLKNSDGDVVGNITAGGTLNVVSVSASNAGTGSSALVTRDYVDTLFAGLNWHDPVSAATTEALPTCTYNNGTSGVGATLTASANGALSVDSGAPAVGVSILVKNQATATQNGIYVVTATGGASTTIVSLGAITINSGGTNIIVTANNAAAGANTGITQTGTITDNAVGSNISFISNNKIVQSGVIALVANTGTPAANVIYDTTAGNKDSDITGGALTFATGTGSVINYVIKSAGSAITPGSIGSSTASLPGYVLLDNTYGCTGAACTPFSGFINTGNISTTLATAIRGVGIVAGSPIYTTGNITVNGVNINAKNSQVKLDSNGVNIKSKNTKLTIDGKGIHINTKNKK
jgi:hypothetical protein